MKLIENISIVALVLTFLSGNMKNVGREVNVEEENTVVRSYASDDSFVFSDEPYAVSETSIVNKELKLLNKGVDKYKITTENGSFIVDSSEEKETSVNVPLQIAVGEGEQKILVEGMEGDDIVSEEETIISTLGTSEQFYASTLGYETIDKASLDYRLENELISEIEYENQIEKYTLASNSFGSNHNAFDSEDGGPSLDYPIEGRVMVNIDSNGLGYELKPVEGIRVKIEAYNGYDNIMSGYTQEITTDDNGFFLFPYIEEYFYYAYYFEITAYTETNYGNKKYNAKVVDNKKEVYFKKICVDHQNGKIQNSYDIILNNFSCDEDKAFVILYYLSKTVKYISSVDELKSKYETTLIQYPVGRTSFYSKAFDDVPIIGDIAEWRAPFLRGDISIQGTEGRDVYDNGRVILHEYGHFIADKLGVFNKVGGNHSLEDDFINDISLNDGRAGFGAQMAWNEGLADFISVVLNQKLYSKKDSKYSDYDLSSFYDEYGNTTFLRGLGEGNEIVTASIIYQFYKGSYFNGNERAIWSFLSKKQTKLLRTFVSTCLKLFLTAQQETELKTILENSNLTAGNLIQTSIPNSNEIKLSWEKLETKVYTNITYNVIFYYKGIEMFNEQVINNNFLLIDIKNEINELKTLVNSSSFLRYCFLVRYEGFNRSDAKEYSQGNSLISIDINEFSWGISTDYRYTLADTFLYDRYLASSMFGKDDMWVYNILNRETFFVKIVCYNDLIIVQEQKGYVYTIKSDTSLNFISTNYISNAVHLIIT